MIPEIFPQPGLANHDKLANQANHGYHGDVPEIHVRRVDASLLRAVNVEAAKQGMTQRDFIIRALTVAVGWENGRSSEGGSVHAQDADRAGSGELGALPKKRRGKTTVSDGPPDCPRCGKQLREWGPEAWNCENCRTNYPKA